MNGRSAVEFISKLRALDVVLSVHENRLRINAPAGVITPELRRELAARKAELLTLLQESPIESPQSQAISSVSRADKLPLSFAQQRLWFLAQMEGASEAYHLPLTLYLKGALDRAALRRALDRILARHEALRTTFSVSDGEPVQRITALENSHFLLIENDLRLNSSRDELSRLIELEEGGSFDFENGPLIRGRLIQLAEDEHALLVTTHHIASDGWSMALLSKELRELYAAFLRGQDDPLPKLPVQYADYSVWQRKQANGDLLKEQAKYWKAALAGAPTLLEVPADHPRPVVQDYSGAFEELVLNQELTAALKEFSRRHRVTMFRTLMAAWATLLSRLSGQQDVLIGTPVANRGQKELQDLIGFFVNTLVVRLNLSGSPTVKELIEQTKTQTMAALEHQDLPFDKVVELVHPPRNPSYSPLIQVMFAWQNNPPETLEFPGIAVQVLPTRRAKAKFDLLLDLQETGNIIIGGIEYATSLFEQATIQRYAAYFLKLLKAMVASDSDAVDRLPILPEAERRQVLVEWNKTADFLSDKCIHQCFEDQAARTPDAVAIVFEDASLSYADLDRRANQLAHYLRQLGVKPDSRVAICAQRSFEMVIAVLAVLKAGGAYVPLDPAYPPERLHFILEDSDPVALLIQDELRRLVSGAGNQVPVIDLADPSQWRSFPETNPDPQTIGLNSRHLAYVIYTSGSTGSPKGCLLEHANVTRLFTATDSWFHFDQRDVWTLFHSYAFDFSVWEIWGALLYGGRLVIVHKDVARSATDFYHLLCREKVTVLNQTPSAFRQLMAAQSASRESHCLRYIVFGGEALEVATLKPWFEQNRDKQTKLINMYGITETTVHVTYRSLIQADTQHRGASPVGAAIPDLTIYILDPYGEPVPIGVTGELYVGGAGVARGYLNRPELTAARFLPDPFSSKPGARMYRTGDLGHRLPDGSIEYLGRNDFQVKIRGFRIELGEIETRLGEYPGVGEVAVIAREDTPGDKRLVAYYTTPSIESEKPGAFSAEQIRTHLLKTLPEYMVPAAYVHLATLPLTNNGKLDRKALPAPEIESYSTHGYEPPVGETETRLAEIWADLLKVDRVGRRDNFFDLGGHSLLAITLIERMRSRGLNVDVPSLFAKPTLLDVVATAEVNIPAFQIPANSIPPGCKRIRPEMLPLIDLTQDQIDKLVTTVPGGAENVQDIYPLVHLQEGILYRYLMGGTGDTYLVSTELSFDKRELLNDYLAALQVVIDRHDVLRTAMLWDGFPEPVQVVWRQAKLHIEEIKLDPWAANPTEQLYARFDPRRFRIDVRSAPLIRIYLAQDRKTGRWLLMQLMHHLVIDGTTLEMMRVEIQAKMLSPSKELPAPLPFRNLVAHARLGVSKREQENFFRKMLGDVDEPFASFGILELQGDSSTIEESTLALSDESFRQVRSVARHAGVTFATLCHLAWALVLAKVSGWEDVVFGTVVFGRMQGGEGFDRTMGPFINTLPVRISVGTQDVAKSVRGVQTLLLGLMKHEHASLSLAQRCSGVHAPTPLFTSLLNYRYHAPAAVSEESRQAWQGIERLRMEERTDYPFYLSVEDLGSGLAFTAQTLPSVGSKRLCEMMCSALESLVYALESNPSVALSSLDILPPSERQHVLSDWNRTEMDYPCEVPLAALVEKQAARKPDAIAVAFGKESITYRELNERANQFARELVKCGAKPDELVGIFVERSVEMVTALLAVVKSGAAYLPMDPNLPAARLQCMMEESGLCAVVTQQHLLSNLPASSIRTLIVEDKGWRANECENLNVPTTPEHLAYVMYTSGSSGKPKGVQIPRSALTNFLWSMREWLQLTERDRWLAVTTISFDIAGLEIWLPLVVGAQTIVASRSDAADGNLLRGLLEKHDITAMQATPITWWLLFGAGWQGKTDLQAICGGEAMPRELAAQLVPLVGKLWNLYGPTETTIWSTGYLVKDGQAPVLIGRPIGNTQCFILNEQQQPVPVGCIGELYIAGDGLARGYLKRPELTREKFVPNPFNSNPSARMYRTGDLARFMPNGEIECLGRTDHQVKIRGHRIELGEIESRLAEYPGVREPVVVAREDTPGNKRVVAYFTSSPDTGPKDNTISAEQLRSHLQSSLPDYMIPAAYVQLQSIPLTANGKLDRKALPVPESDSYSTQRYEPPVGETEIRLAAVWADLLKLDRVGRHDNFFDLGGHSLLAVQLMLRLQEFIHGESVSLTALLEAPTVERFAAWLQEREAKEQKVLVRLRAGSPMYAPFFCVHASDGVAIGMRPLAMAMETDVPFYCLQAKGLDGSEPFATVEENAQFYLAEIRKVQPQGPYHLGGYCYGGIVAFEMARMLVEAGEAVATLVLIDCYNPSYLRFKPTGEMLWRLLQFYVRRVGLHARALHYLHPAVWFGYSAGRVRAMGVHFKHFIKKTRKGTPIFPSQINARQEADDSEMGTRFEKMMLRLRNAGPLAARKLDPKPFGGGAIIIRVSERSDDPWEDYYLGWKEHVRGPLESFEIESDHESILREPAVREAAHLIEIKLRESLIVTEEESSTSVSVS